MTPDPTNPRHALEASLTALLLGELPPDQAAFLRQAIATDPELAWMYARLERTITLVRETAAEPAPQPATHPQPLKLSSERREQLLQRFKTVNHPALAKSERDYRSWLVPTAIAASLLALVGVWLLSSSTNHRSATTLARNEPASPAMGAWSLENNRVHRGTPWQTTFGASEKRLSPDNPPTSRVSSKGTEQAGREIVSSQSAGASSFAATPPTTIFLPPKLPETDSELARTAKALDGSTAGYSFYGVGGGAPATTPAENRPLDEPRETALALSPPLAKEEALARRYGLRLPKSEAKEPHAQAGKPPITYSGQDRAAGMPAAGTEIYRGVSVLTNGRIEMQPVTPEAAQWQAGDTLLADKKDTQLSEPASTYAFEQLPPSELGQLFNRSALSSQSTRDGVNATDAGGLRQPAWSDREHQRNGGVLKVESAGQLADNRTLSPGLANSGLAGSTAAKPTLGDVPAAGTLFQEAPPQQKQELAFEPGVDQKVTPRASESFELARQRGKDVEKVTAVNVDPTTGLPLADSLVSVDPTTGLPLRQLRSDKGPSITNNLNVVGYVDVPLVSNTWSVHADLKGFYDDSKNSLSELTDAGQRLFEGGKPKEAEAKLKEALKKDPQNQTAYYYLNLISEAKFQDALNRRDGASSNGLVEIEKAWVTPRRNNNAENAHLYADASTKLEELQHFDQVLRMKAAGEKTDLQLPKGSMVEIVDTATTKPVESPSLGQKLSGLVSGTVERNARVKVERDQSDLAGVAGASEKQTTAGYDPYFVKTETEAIQSDAVLGAVVDKLKLDEAWAKKRGASTPLPKSEAVKMLKEKLDVRSVGKTDLLDIGVKSDKPEEAASLANAVAESYRARRLEQRKELAQAEVASLQDHLAENEQRIREAQTNVDALREKYKISDYMAGGNQPTVLITAETLRRVEQLRIESQAELARQQALLTKLNSMRNDPDALAKALPTNGIQDQVLGSLLQQKALTGQKLASLQSQYGPENAETKKAAAMADDLKSKINDRVAGVISGLEAHVTSLGQSLTNLQVEVDRAMKTDLQKATETEPYWEAKQHLEELQRLGQVLSMKIAGEKTEHENLTAGRNDDARPPKPTTPPPEPQPEIQTHDNAFSTFSLNVSDVSFKLAAASLEKAVLPEPASIRSEEFINAFDYRDPEPAPGAPIAFAWERARYPFAQNRDLLRFSLKTAALGRQAGRPLNLVLLLDNSGSMERADRVSIIREALHVLATQLQPNDTLSVVLFARTPRLWVDGVPGNQASKVADEVSGLTPEGGTNLGDALDLAYQTALRHYLMAGINRVVLLTDGAANLGNVQPEELKKKVEANRKQGVALDCFGIGWEGYNDDLLEVLTRNGDGRYGFINTPEEAATEFAGQLAGALHVAASDVKVQVEFNAKRVTAYRQIGYAKHQLTKEQFRDNSVDAAELGAAESGNALYVVDVNGGGDGPLATVRVRYKVPGTMQYQEHEWTVPYTGNAAPLEQATPALRLAASASAFSEWLATSPYAAEVTPDSVLGYLRGVPEVYGADARPKKLEWMIRQAKSLVGTGGKDGSNH